MVNGKTIGSHYFCLDPFFPIASSMSFCLSFHRKHTLFRRKCKCFRIALKVHGRIFRQQFLNLRFHILRSIRIHLNNGVCHMEKSPAAARNQNRRNACFFIQVPHSSNKRRDRLLLSTDHTLHKGIPHKKIRCGSVLINQKTACVRFDSFHNTCRL